MTCISYYQEKPIIKTLYYKCREKSIFINLLLQLSSIERCKYLVNCNMVINFELLNILLLIDYLLNLFFIVIIS